MTTSRHSRLVSSTFILSTEVTRLRAASNAVRAIRSISSALYSQRSEAWRSVRVFSPK